MKINQTGKSALEACERVVGCGFTVLKSYEIGSTQAPGNAASIQVVGGHFHSDAIAGGEANPALAHFAADSGEDHVFIVQLDPEHSVGQRLEHRCHHFNRVFFAQ